MENSGRVVAIHLCVGHRKPMKRVEEVRALLKIGLEGDFHARGGKRQVLLVEGETLETLHLSPGDVRENITTQGISLMDLSAGQILEIVGARSSHGGMPILLEITGPCAPCQRMEEIREGLEEELKGRRGILVRVMRSGTIRVGDSIKVNAEREKKNIETQKIATIKFL